MTSTEPLAPSVRRGYALGSVATGTFGTVPGLLLLPYLTDHLGIAAVVAGAIVLVPKAWDVLLNPVAGRISDRSTNPAGRRRPFLLRGGLALAACFALLFAGPTEPAWLGGAYVVVLFLACATAYAFFQVPYVAMPAEMTLDYAERTRLMFWRVAVLALAILVSGATAPLVVDAFGGDPSTSGYRLMGLYVAVLLAAGVVGAWWGTRDAPELGTTDASGTLREQLRVVAGAPDFRALLTCFVVQALGVGALLAGVAYVADDLLASTAASTVLFAAFVGPAILVTPLWERYARTRGKRSGYVLSSVLLALGALTLLSTRSGEAGWGYAAAVLVGIGYAGDFRVDGVTSVSVDLHKYAYAPKGVSLLLHRTPALRRSQYFASADWPGYTMLNATMQSTKSGGPLAAAWATVQAVGDDGYERLVATALTGTDALVDGIGATEHLTLVSRPDSTLVALTTDDALDVFTLSDEMLGRGWYVQPQMRFGDLPATLHLTVSAATAASVDDFLAALRESVAAAVAAGPVGVDPDLAVAAAALDPEALDEATFDGLLALAGLGGGDAGFAVPARMAEVNALLDVAPPALREALLVAFLDRLSR